MNTVSRARRQGSTGGAAAPPGSLAIRFVTADQALARNVRPSNPWSAWSAWPGHPAIQPPLPRPATSSTAAPTETPRSRVPVAPRRAEPLTPARPPMQRLGPQSDGNGRRPATPVRKDHQVIAPTAPRPASPELSWPAGFDDWMIDIVRRRPHADEALAYKRIRLLVFGHGSTLGRSRGPCVASAGVLWTARVLVDNSQS